MEGVSYVGLFSTKGIEYLFVIGYLVILVVFWKIINRSTAGTGAAAAVVERVGVKSGWFRLAEGFFFHQGHSWASPEQGDVVRVGVDDFAQKLLGKPQLIELPALGTQLEQGADGWRFKIDSKSIGMLSPVNGRVVEINQEVLKSPELICTEPYGKGWLMKVKASRVKADLKNLFSGKLASAWMEQTVDKLRATITGDLGVVLQDGGTTPTGFVRNLSSEKWEEIARDFLLSD